MFVARTLIRLSLPSQAVFCWPRFWTRGVNLDYFSTFLKYDKAQIYHQVTFWSSSNSRLSFSSPPLLTEPCCKQRTAAARPVALSQDWRCKSWGIRSRQLYTTHPLLHNYAREESAPILHTQETKTGANLSLITHSWKHVGPPSHPWDGALKPGCDERQGAHALLGTTHPESWHGAHRSVCSPTLHEIQRDLKTSYGRKLFQSSWKPLGLYKAVLVL